MPFHPPPDGGPVSEFAARVDAFLAEFFSLQPVAATSVGMHDHDGRWPDLTESGRAARLAFYDRWSSGLAGLDDADLTRDERADRDLLLLELAAYRFGDDVLREDRWNPLD